MGNEMCPEELQSTPDHLFARLQVQAVTASTQVCLLGCLPLFSAGALDVELEEAKGQEQGHTAGP